MSFSQPSEPRPTQLMLSTIGFESVSIYARLLSTTAPASAAWGTNNIAIAIPYTISRPTTISRGWWYNGATAAGTVDVGIYDEAGNRLCSTGPQTQSGINALQEFAITSTVITAPNGYLVMCCSLSTATVFSSVLAIAAVARAAGFAQVANGSGTLGATLTWATYAQTLWPVFGFVNRGFV